MKMRKQQKQWWVALFLFIGIAILLIWHPRVTPPTTTITHTATSSLTVTPTLSPQPFSDLLYYMIVLDASQEMTKAFDGRTKWDAAQNSTKRILEGLPPNAHYGLVVVGGSESTSFADPCNEPSTPSLAFSSRNNITNTINQLEPKGGGSFYNAFVLAINQFKSLPVNTIKTLIYITGATDNCKSRDEWKDLERFLKLTGIEFKLYSEIIILDEDGIKSQALADRLSELANISVQAPQSNNQLQQSSSNVVSGIATSISTSISMLPTTIVSTVATTNPVPTVPMYVAMKNPNVSDPVALGKINYTYPLSIPSGSSELITVRIHPSEGLMNFKLSQAIQATPVSDFESCDNNIGITREMRVELDESPAFKIQNSYPLKQKVSLVDSSEVTSWQWIILPIIEGSHKLPIKVYWNNDDIPFWICNLKIFVGSSTLTPSITPSVTQTFTATATQTPSLTITPTATATSTLTVLENVEHEMQNNLNTWLFYIVGLIGTMLAGLFGIIKKHLNRQDIILLKKNKLGKVKGKERSELNDEIAYLESIKWWQFWR